MTNATKFGPISLLMITMAIGGCGKPSYKTYLECSAELEKDGVSPATAVARCTELVIEGKIKCKDTDSDCLYIMRDQ